MRESRKTYVPLDDLNFHILEVKLDFVGGSSTCLEEMLMVDNLEILERESESSWCRLVTAFNVG